MIRFLETLVRFLFPHATSETQEVLVSVVFALLMSIAIVTVAVVLLITFGGLHACWTIV